MKQWDLERPAGRCASTGRPLEEGDDFYTVLFEDGDAFRRADYAVDAWHGPPPGSFCHFKTRVPLKAKRKRLLVDDDILDTFFDRLASETEPLRIAFRFVVALLLMRKRRLRYDGSTTQHGIELWRMTRLRDGSTHDVVNPKLTDERIEAVSRQVTAILHGDMSEHLAALDEHAPNTAPAGDARTGHGGRAPVRDDPRDGTQHDVE